MSRTQIPGNQILDKAVDTVDLADAAVTDEKLSATGVASGSYTKVTVNGKGRVTSAENPTTLAGYGITDAFSTQTANQIPWITADVGQLNPENAGQIPADATFRILRAEDRELSIADGGAKSPLVIGLADNPILPGKGGVILPIGTSDDRPNPANAKGLLRYNEQIEEIETYADGEWVPIVDAADKRLKTANTILVQKNPGPGQFSSIKAAIDSITDSGSSNRYVVRVAGGSYEEDPIQMKRFVSVSGDNAVSVIVTAKDPNSDLFTVVNDSSLEHMTLSGATGVNSNGEAVAAIRFHDAEENQPYRSFVCSDVRFGASNTCIKVTSNTKYTSLFVFNGQFGGSMPYVRALHAESYGGGTARILARSCTTRGSNGAPELFGYSSGPGAELFLNSGQFRTSIAAPSGIGVLLRNGGTARVLSATFRGFSTGILVENAGSAPFLYGYNVGLESNVKDLVVNHPGTSGTFQGSLTHSKLEAPDVEHLALMFMDPVDSGLHVIGHLNLGKDVSRLTDVTDLLIETPPMGLIEGGVMSRGAGTTVNVSAGSGYVRTGEGDVKYITFPAMSLNLTPGTSPFLYINSNSQLQQAGSPPSNFTNILIGRVLVGPSSIISLGDLAFRTASYGNTIDNYLRTSIGPVYVSGSIVTENATTPRALDITAGQYWFGTVQRNPNAFTALTFLDGYKIGSTVSMAPKQVVPNDTYTDGNATNGLVNMTPGYFAKHALYQTGSGPDVLFLLAHATQEYATIEEVYAAPLPTPAIDPGGTPHVAALIVQQGRNDFVDILDVRPKHFRSGAATGSVSNDHGDLLGLGDDDHPQYLLVDGTRALSDDLSLGGNNILNVGLINGLDIFSHAARHLPNGADPLATGQAVSLTSVSTNTVGVANSFARADHTHQISGFQPLNSELTQLAGLNTHGIAIHVEPNVWTTRQITSSGGALTITNPGGIAGNIDINLAPVGTAGTYYGVTTNANGAVVSGTQQVPFSAVSEKPTTLAGYGITDSQPLDSDLTALANSGGTGFYIRTGDGTSVTRTLVAPAAGLTIANPDGVGNAPTFALANDLAAVEGLTTNGLAVRMGTDTWVTRTITQPAAGLTISNPLTGNITFALANDLLALENLTTVGIAARTTAAGAWATRTLTTSTLSFTNPAGTAGDIGINLSTVGAAGTYKSVTTDQYGRITAGTNPTTLDGFGITDAVNIAQLGVPSGVATLDSNGKLNLAQVPSIAITDSFVVANQAAMLGLNVEVGDIAIRTDQNETYILQAMPATQLSNWKKLATPTDAVQSVNGQTGTVTLNYVSSVAATQPTEGLTITGGPITSTGTFAFALANDLAGLEALTGTGFPVRTANDTWTMRSIGAGAGIAVANGDGVASAPTVSLQPVGTAGTYKSVTTDQYGRVTAGTNPTTLAGYGITDAQPLDSDLTALANTNTTGLYTITGVGTSATRSLVAGTGISITNPTGVGGNLTISATALGTVTSVGLAMPNLFTVSNSPVTTSGNISVAVNPVTANTVWAGPTSGNAAVPTFRKLGITELDSVAISAPAANQTLTFNGTNWVNSAVNPGSATGNIGVAPAGGGSGWTLLSGTRYYADFVHNLGTSNVVITIYNVATNAIVIADEVVVTNGNSIRVTVVGNSRTLRVVVVANGMSIAAGGSTPSAIQTSWNGTTVNTATTRLNIVGSTVVADSGGGVTTVSIGARFTNYANSFDTPNNPDWAVNSFAPVMVDPVNNALNVRSFSNTVEQGVGFMCTIPTGGTIVNFRIRGRSAVAQTAATVVQWRVYFRMITNNGALGAWVGPVELTNMNIPANATFQSYLQNAALTNVGLIAGQVYQFELTRRVTGVTGTNLPAPFLLAEATFEFA